MISRGTRRKGSIGLDASLLATIGIQRRGQLAKQGKGTIGLDASLLATIGIRRRGQLAKRTQPEETIGLVVASLLATIIRIIIFAIIFITIMSLLILYL